jgi:predicted NBD/HSP70 family sugar kinase
LFFGIDVGGTKIQFAVYSDEQVVILDKVPTPNSYDDFLKLVERNHFEAERNHYSRIIENVGIGIPGTFTKEKIIWVPNIPYLEGKDLAGDLKQRLKANVQIGNDAQLALAGEVWKGAGQGSRDAILMSIGTGIGGAIMVGGKLVKGRRGASGAFGWINLDATKPGDKDHGYLENNASGKAIGKMGENHSPYLTTYEIVEKARLGDDFSINTMKEAGHLIGAALASIVSVLDTEVVILSGGLSEEIDTFKDSMNKSFIEFAAPGVSTVPIIKSQLGNLSGVYGAIRLAIVKEDLWI